MPGPWTQADVDDAGQRPGLYANFQAEATALISGGLTGVVALAGEAAWGPDEVVQEITTEQELIDYYTNEETAPFDIYTQCLQILKGGANKVICFRMEGVGAAVATKNFNDSAATPVITVNGKYKGDRGNNFTITIAANALDGNRKDVTIKESAVVLKTWTTRINNGGAGMVTDLVAQINDDADNYWITLVKIADGNNILANVADVALLTGNDGAGVLSADFDTAMDALELEDWSVFVADTQDGAILTNIKNWIITDLRGTGKKVIWVTGSDTADAVSAATADAEGYNHEGIVYCYPGLKYADAAGVTQTGKGSRVTAARVAGIIASRELSQSVTFFEITDIVDVETRLTNAQIKLLLASGVLPVIWDGNKFKIERGINTRSTLGTGQSNQFKKIQIIRILDGIENSLTQTSSDYVVGKYLNSVDGRNGLLSLIRSFLDSLVRTGVIESDFTVELDDNNPPTEDKVYVSIGIKPIDSIEFIYLTVTLNA